MEGAEIGEGVSDGVEGEVAVGAGTAAMSPGASGVASLVAGNRCSDHKDGQEPKQYGPFPLVRTGVP